MVLAFQQRHGEALTVINSALEQKPDDTELRLARARVLSYQSVYQEAMTTVDDVLENAPENLEALNLAGRIALYQQRPTVAEERFNAVLAIEADNLEALIGLYDALYSRGDDERASRPLARAAALAPDHVDVLTRLQPASFSSGPRHMLTMGGSRSTLDRAGLVDWNDRNVEYRHLQSNGNQQYVRVEHDHRFGTHDTLVEVGANFRQKTRVPIEVAIGFTPGDEFLPAHFGRIGASTRLTDGSGGFGTLVLNAMFQYSTYANGNTQRSSLGVDYYLPGADAWLSPSLGMVHDQDGRDTFAWSLGANWQLRGTTRVGASYSDAPETENLITTDTKIVSAYVRQDLFNRWVLYLTWARYNRENSYSRRWYDAVLQYRF